jgi:DtxR family Mn-dependent transcriptional regulator
MDRRQGAKLTPEGRQSAEATLRRHYLVERLLVDVLGLDWAEVHEEADRIEHALSPRLEEQLFQRLGRPSTCPHGNPLPGSPDEQRLIRARALSDARPDERATVLRVTEEGEEEAELMHYLLDNGLLPGARVTVHGFDKESETLQVAGPKGELQVPLAYAQKLRIE